MLVSLSEYAQIHGKSGDTIRRMAENGCFITAKKIGRNWAIDNTEPYPVKARKTKKRIISYFSVLRVRRTGLRFFREF